MKNMLLSRRSGDNNHKIFRLKGWHLAGLRAAMLVILEIAALIIMAGGANAASGQSTTVWIQVTDSCRQALSGATFTVKGPGLTTTTAPTSGSTPVSLGGSGCPIPQGSCVSVTTGCTFVNLPVPASGTSTFTIIVAKTAPGQGTNQSYASCTGGSDCHHGPEVATVVVSASGAVSATTHNTYPDGVSVTWGPFNGTKGDPVLFHEFGIGNGSCDGDGDADDHLTGAPSQHCDGDQDKH